MSTQVHRSVNKPLRKGISWDELWNGPDKGLMACWEVGRQEAETNPELARRAKNDELPLLDWKGGIEKKLKLKVKYGSLNYLATWQGLRGEDLDIDLDREAELVCAKTGMRVIYTGDASKYAQA